METEIAKSSNKFNIHNMNGANIKTVIKNHTYYVMNYAF